MQPSDPIDNSAPQPPTPPPYQPSAPQYPTEFMPSANDSASASAQPSQYQQPAMPSPIYGSQQPEAANQYQPAQYAQTSAPAAYQGQVPAYQQPMPNYGPTQPTQPSADQSDDSAQSSSFKHKKRRNKQFRNPLETMRPGERMVCEVKRHPIGLAGIYGGAIFMLLLLAVVGYIIGPSIATDYPKNQVYGIVTIFLLLAGTLAGLFVIVAHIVYWGNRWIVTDDSVTQVLQNSLFDKRSSQLSMANLEDITVEQNGILPHMFNYGVLKAETAGERSKFRFAFCPDPNSVAQKILATRESFEQDNYRQQAQQPQQFAYQPPAPQAYQPPTGPPQQQ